MVKVCRKCGIEKDSSSFSLNHKMPSGRRHSCKGCEKAAEKARRNNKAEEIRAYDRERSKTPARIKHNTENTRKFRSKNPEKYSAHIAVANAIKSGKLVKQPCSVCGNEKSEAHHEDYSKPLDVWWLCSQHHKDRHKELRW